MYITAFIDRRLHQERSLHSGRPQWCQYKLLTHICTHVSFLEVDITCLDMCL